MSNDSPDPGAPDNANSFEARLVVAIEKLSGWPLSKSETFSAFALMGLTSRLQPVEVNDKARQALVVDLAIRLGDMAALKSETK